MSPAPADDQTTRTPLRLWPGVTAAALLGLFWFLIPRVVPGTFELALYGGLAAVLGVLLWWLLFSRAPWGERLGALALMAVGLAGTSRLVDESVATAGMGMLFYIYAIPVLALALVAWAVASRDLGKGARRAGLVATLLLACGAWTALRIDGVTGGTGAQFSWRWAETPEDRLLARARAEVEAPRPTPVPARTPEEPLPDRTGDEPAPLAPEPSAEPPDESPAGAAHAAHRPAATVAAQWPGFRGRGRDGVIPDVRIRTDWSTSPPVELWRRPVGPGWSSFAVDGARLYTQEQRGEDEIVACYDATTGEPVWMHRDEARFWEANAGPGPRATPTLDGGLVYAFGATGILNVLDAAQGSVVWSRDAASDTGTEVPYWGFASSPLVVEDVVIVAVAGQLVGYDRVDGERRWLGPAGETGYSSPHRATIDGVAQVLLLNGDGVMAVSAGDGTLLWKHEWPGDGIVQPAVTSDGDVLIGTGSGMGDGVGAGVQRITVTRGPGGWTVEEGWTSNGLKPYFNDYVVHGGHAFGFDGGILACIDLEDGERLWKGGRYGHGQLLLLADQGVLLVVSEKGDLALVAASPDGFSELARIPAIEGKTWNHPALVDDLLLVRNGQEMVAYRLAVESG
jgi:outer membrane protein assembly factor BamB